MYEFWGDPRRDRRALYVGKASGGPGLRIKAHFDNLAPWALEARWIKLTPLPFGMRDEDVLRLEEARIRELRPRGNQVHNRAYYDGVWARRVAVAHAGLVGVRVGWGVSLGLVWGLWVQRARWLGGRLLWSVGGGLVVAFILLMQSK